MFWPKTIYQLTQISGGQIYNEFRLENHKDKSETVSLEAMDLLLTELENYRFVRDVNQELKMTYGRADDKYHCTFTNTKTQESIIIGTMGYEYITLLDFQNGNFGKTKIYAVVGKKGYSRVKMGFAKWNQLINQYKINLNK